MCHWLCRHVRLVFWKAVGFTCCCWGRFHCTMSSVMSGSRREATFRPRYWRTQRATYSCMTTTSATVSQWSPSLAVTWRLSSYYRYHCRRPFSDRCCSSAVWIGYCTAGVDKRGVHSTSLYHCSQCSIVLKPRSDFIAYTVVCFVMHDSSRKLWKHSTSASWVWFKSSLCVDTYLCILSVIIRQCSWFCSWWLLLVNNHMSTGF